jgi:hypothetical protein
MSALRAHARISLLSAECGGLKAPLRTGTRSLLLSFDSGIEDSPLVTIGAALEPMGFEALDPGARGVDVVLTFWADEAEIFVCVGESFELRYGSRPVGEGTITEVERDRS